ncbi:hypothetical protein HPB47_003595 [Ixodes persulcatus]|uniref:Uncharacterized protein n=1 Tax=Ixodes persulcatus TaxID=34615 RepID=A0AC60PJ18_IXOPE|nr:hypothetical protein HPB47_003595 [Ixodes persulcatus]
MTTVCTGKQRCKTCGEIHPTNQPCQGKYCPNCRKTGHTVFEAEACQARNRADDKLQKRAAAGRHNYNSTVVTAAKGRTSARAAFKPDDFPSLPTQQLHQQPKRDTETSYSQVLAPKAMNTDVSHIGPPTDISSRLAVELAQLKESSRKILEKIQQLEVKYEKQLRQEQETRKAQAKTKADFDRKPPSVEPPPPAFNLYDPEGTILNIKLAYKKIQQTKLNARGEPPEASIPSGTFRRHETVTLRRLRAQAGITPARTQRWERAARERKSKLANASTAVDHDYSLLSKKQRKEEACSEGCIYCRNRDVKCDECHLIWHCPIFNEERTKALNTLEQQHRPTCFEAWCKPVGDKDMRVAVLSGLLGFLSETGLDIHI